MNNFFVRTLSAVVFSIVMICGILLNQLAFGALFLVIMTMSLQEFYRISIPEEFGVQKRIAYLAAAAFFILVYCHCAYFLSTSWMPLLLVLLVAIPVSCIFKKDHSDFGKVSLIYSGLLYIGLPIGLVPFLAFNNGIFYGKLLMSFFIIIWMSDVGAYCLGSAFGQRKGSHKLAPAISPKKSWWGFAGAVFLGSTSAVALHFVSWLSFPLIHCIAIGLIVSVSAVAGDLVESMWKRHWGVKDSGNVIPGHGGMLDRFDSSLIAIPAAAAYLAAFALI